MRHLLPLALLLVVPACGGETTAPADPAVGLRKHPSEAVRPAEPIRAKRQAPVRIQTERLGQTSATLVITMGTDVEDLAIHAYGAEGLQVTGEAVSHVESTLPSGESVRLDVPYTGTGSLAVVVEGTFRGVAASRVASFTVGSRRVAPKADGDDIVRLPARQR